MGERKDLGVYSMAVRTAAGEVTDWLEEVPKEFVAHVQRGTTPYLDGSNRLSVSFNYERWLGSTY